MIHNLSFQNTFLGNPNFASFIRVLNNIVTSEDIQREESVTTFLSSKYSVTLSNRTFHYLMRYLQQQQSMGQPHVLLHVLHAKVDVRLQDALGAASSKHEAVQRVLTDQPASSIKEEISNLIGGVTIKQEVPNYVSYVNYDNVIFLDRRQDRRHMCHMLLLTSGVDSR